MEACNLIPAEDWQSTKNTVMERNSFMFNNELMSDIHFIVGETDSLKTFPAHKYVLASSSSIFYAMFYGGLAEDSNEIKIPDSEPEAFEEFLRFLYTDQAHLVKSTVVGVLYLSEKYLVPSLKSVCSKFLRENLSDENAMTILQTARRYREDELEKKCWEIIRQATSEIITREEFLDIPYDLLKSFLKEEKLGASEIDIFKAVDRWAEARCLQKNQEITGQNKRDHLSECLYLIRFPTMSCEQFVAEVIPTKILNIPELADISLTWNSSQKHVCKTFSQTPRRVYVLRCVRFTSLQSTWNYDRNSVDGINFSVNKSVKIFGIGLYGESSLSCTYSVEVNLLEQDSQTCLTKVDKTEYKSINISSKSSSNSSLVYPGYDVWFGKPVTVHPGKMYSIHALISGPASVCGSYGNDGVEVDGVKFSFSSCPQSKNSTGVESGQIPEIIFTV